MNWNVRRILGRFTIVTFILLSIYLFLELVPNLLFQYHYNYLNCQIYSDRPISSNIEKIIAETNSRISKSVLYEADQTFKFFLCNDTWRLGFFTQGHSNAGTVAQYNFTRYIFFRPCDIPNNQIIPAESWHFNEDSTAFADRPLSYYFAHEMMHVMQSRYFGRGDWKYPTWLTEGYADYIAKNGQFDFEENLALLRQNDPKLHPDYGLYRYYHLLVAYLMDYQGKDMLEIYENPPVELKLKEEILKLTF